MLDVIADFWKPVKKSQTQDKLQPEQLQVGSSLGFGFVPQTLLSGRRLTVGTINTYQFGEESLTSFVLTQEAEAGTAQPSVSMIVAESEGEYYLAISRRISINDHSKLFDAQEFENILNKPEGVRLACKEVIVDFKGWVVNSYKREIQGLKGRIFKGDFRNVPLPPAGSSQEFEYTLLVSDSNEHAIEIEKYSDGRVETYATVYRRLNDIGEINYNNAADSVRNVKLASETAPAKPVEKTPVLAASPTAPAVNNATPVISTPAETKPTPITLQEFQATPVQAVTASIPAPAQVKKEPAVETRPIATPSTQQGKTTMEAPAINGTRNDMNTTEAMKPKLYVQAAQETQLKQEVKAVSNQALKNFETDAIECDLRVANKIIDEAIRNEMRLTDIVRRIIELPVAYPESVQIPMTLTDEDYALLAIRYGISSSDRNAIKRRIIEDLNDFSGGKKQQQKAA